MLSSSLPSCFRDSGPVVHALIPRANSFFFFLSFFEL